MIITNTCVAKFYISFIGSDYNLNPLSKISVGFLLPAGRNSKGHYVCSGVC